MGFILTNSILVSHHLYRLMSRALPNAKPPEGNANTIGDGYRGSKCEAGLLFGGFGMNGDAYKHRRLAGRQRPRWLLLHH